MRLVIDELHSDVTKTRKDGTRGRLRVDYGEHRNPDAALKWLWTFVVCRAGGYAESACSNARLACSSRVVVGDLLGITTPGRLQRCTMVREVEVCVAGTGDVGAVASLRSLGSADGSHDCELEQRIAAWLTSEGDRRTVWVAAVAGAPVGMASLFEYRRMPSPGRADARWGYVSNMFVHQEHRNLGIGSALMASLIAAADDRGYVRLVLSPSAPALRFFERAGFVVADDAAGADRLLVRRRRPG